MNLAGRRETSKEMLYKLMFSVNYNKLFDLYIG